MPDELMILIMGSSGIPDQTREALREVLAEHGTDVLDEASRIAAAQHVGSDAPMITPGLVRESAQWVRRGYIQKGLSKQQKSAATAGGVSTFIGGVFVNNIDKTWGAIGFVICGLVLVLSLHWGTK